MRTAILLSLMVLQVSRATAQDVVAPSDNTIIVTGKRQNRTEAKRQARDFVALTGRMLDTRQVARWTEPVCLHVAGMADAGTRTVVDRVRAVATEARVPITKASCESNLLIMFTDDANAYMERVKSVAPSSYQEVAVDERGSRLFGSAPIRWWYQTAIEGADGGAATQDPPAAVYAALAGSGLIELPNAPATSSYRSGHATAYTRRVLRTATVLVDIRQIQGVSLDTIASFSALVGLAELKPGDPPPGQSVLAAFSREGAALDLTVGDKAFLSALYKMPLNWHGFRQRGLLIKNMTNALASGR